MRENNSEMSSDLLNVISDIVGIKKTKNRLFASKTHIVQIHQRLSSLNLHQNHLKNLLKYKVAGPHPLEVLI